MSQAWTQEKRDKQAAQNSQHYIITDLTNNQETLVFNLKAWCTQNSYTYSTMSRIANGIYKSHKGMTCRKVTKEEYDALLAA